MPGHRDWTPEEQAIVDRSYSIWLICKDGRRKGKNVVAGVANQLLPRLRATDPNAAALADAWLARRWPQEIGR